MKQWLKQMMNKFAEKFFTIHVGGCLAQIAMRIQEWMGNYILSLKRNQGDLHQGKQTLFMIIQIVI